MQALSNIVTKIETQKKNKDRVNIFINGEFSFSCSTEIVFSSGLKTGKEVDLKSLRDMVEEDSYIKGKNAALSIIERSYKSEKEIADKLNEKGYSEKTINRIMSFLKEYNFLNDHKYAEMYIKDKVSSQGRNKIKYSLTRKGIPMEIVDEELNNISGEQEFDTALKMAEKKYANLLQNERDIRKVYKKTGEFLMRNGFNSSLVKEVLNKTAREEESETIEKVERNPEEIHQLAEKRYNILIKSEKDKRKLYKKLGDYLLRKGFSFDEVKGELKIITKSDNYEE